MAAGARSDQLYGVDGSRRQVQLVVQCGWQQTPGATSCSVWMAAGARYDQPYGVNGSRRYKFTPYLEHFCTFFFFLYRLCKDRKVVMKINPLDVVPQEDAGRTRLQGVLDDVSPLRAATFTKRKINLYLMGKLIEAK